MIQRSSKSLAKWFPTVSSLSKKFKVLIRVTSFVGQPINFARRKSYPDVELTLRKAKKKKQTNKQRNLLTSNFVKFVDNHSRGLVCGHFITKLFYFVLPAFACAIIENGKKKFNAVTHPFAVRVNLKNHQYSFQQQ